MKTEQFDSQMVTTCLQQKVTLFTNMLNISKEIEVQTRQPQMILNDLFARRKVLMDRIDKCNAVISRQLSYLPEAERLHWHTILYDNHYTAVDEDEKSVWALVNKSHELCLRIADINTMISTNLKHEHSNLKKHLSGARKPAYKIK